ncbi:PspC domain-containing protein [Phototrophicus methaneseepsis]|uniref:PspC domain-containing protein n=1 Tax=Phototrophicus methaneseepsis TaxID=2710758 RepID=A0A7S8IGB7_9CHLR|nr:PspC domain-containing protein [Phototrophicus methaneseepsis]QPC84507.1 PspC domain-containing protein [Phototrophicus methaneseepsis]
MIRRFSNRLFGGVCSGLAAMTPFSPAVWRWLFVILTLLTSGAAAVAYLLLWWLLPLENPLHPERRNSAGIIAVLLAIAVIAGWFARSLLAEAFGIDIYWYLAFILLALAFLYKQFTASDMRRSIILGLVALAVPVIALLTQLDTLPIGLTDLILRAWPVVLVIVGLLLLLRPRVPQGGIIALAVSGVLVAGIAAFAFSSRVDEQRTENTVTLAEDVSEGISTIQVDITTLDTDVQVVGRTDNEPTVEAAFVGTTASTVTVSYLEENNIGTFTINETQANAFPQLNEVGRSELQIMLPADVAIAVTLIGEDGTVNFDAATLNLERLKMTLQQGDAIVTLPEYQPRSPSVVEDPGELRVNNGELRVRVPAAVGGRFVLNQASNRQPSLGQDYDDLIYALELRVNEWVLIARNYDDSAIQVTYNIFVPNGRMRLDVVDDPTQPSTE